MNLFTKTYFQAFFLFNLIVSCPFSLTFSFGAETILYAGIGALTSTLYRNFDLLLGCSFSECCSAQTGRGNWMPVDIEGIICFYQFESRCSVRWSTWSSARIWVNICPFCAAFHVRRNCPSSSLVMRIPAALTFSLFLSFHSFFYPTSFIF